MKRILLLMLSVCTVCSSQTLNNCCISSSCDGNNEIVNIPSLMGSKYNKYLTKVDSSPSSPTWKLIQYVFKTDSSKVMISKTEDGFGLT